MKKFFKKKVIIPIVIILLVVVAFFACSSKEVEMFEEEAVEVRDIVTYHNFTGTVEVDESKSVISQASQQIIELLVEEGDEVKVGDVIAVLDSEALKQSIEMKESAFSTTELSNFYNQRDAQKNYNDYKANLDAGLNSQINGAKASMDNAHSAALMAQRTLDEAIAAYEASEPYVAAKTAYDAAKAAYEQVKSQYDAADDAGKAALAQALSDAQTAYDVSNNTMNAMEESKNLSVRTLSDSVLTAISAYETAKKNYDAAVASANQTLETYANAVSKVQGLSSTEVSKMELDTLYDQLEDYTIKATMDGVITALNVKEGSMVTAGVAVAEISDMSKMKIQIKIDEYDILGVEEGKPVSVYIDAIEKEYEGKITKISKKAITANGVSYFTSEVEFASDDNVRVGMSVEVKLVSKEAYGVPSITMDAIRFEKDNTAYVYVRNAEGESVKKPITVGVSDGNYVEILDGLSAGDIILVSPQIDIMEIMMEMQ